MLCELVVFMLCGNYWIVEVVQQVCDVSVNVLNVV